MFTFVRDEIKLEVIANHIMITIPIPFSDDKILIDLKKEHVSDVELLTREIRKLRKENINTQIVLEKEISNLKKVIKDKEIDGYKTFEIIYNYRTDKFTCEWKNEADMHLMKHMQDKIPKNLQNNAILEKPLSIESFNEAIDAYFRIYPRGTHFLNSVAYYNFKFIYDIKDTKYSHINYNDRRKFYMDVDLCNKPCKVTIRPKNNIFVIYIVQYKPIYKQVIMTDEYEKLFIKNFSVIDCDFIYEKNDNIRHWYDDYYIVL
jgi:hypothetical protein